MWTSTSKVIQFNEVQKEKNPIGFGFSKIHYHVYVQMMRDGIPGGGNFVREQVHQLPMPYTWRCHSAVCCPMRMKMDLPPGGFRSLAPYMSTTWRSYTRRACMAWFFLSSLSPVHCSLQVGAIQTTQSLLVSLGASDFDAKLDAVSISVSIESWGPPIYLVRDESLKLNRSPYRTGSPDSYYITKSHGRT
jgi:hypothetical protein